MPAYKKYQISNIKYQINTNESTHDLTIGVSSLDRTSSVVGKPTTSQSGFYRDKNGHWKLEIGNWKLEIPHLNSRAGFTLIEILVAVAVISIISAVGFTSYSQSQKTARDARRKQDLRAISTALEVYRQVNNRYPTTPASLVPTCNLTSAPGTWQLSTAAWIDDSGTSVSPKPLDNTYINVVPKDPLNSGNYNYRYCSPAVANGTCASTQYYFLATLLENANDPDRYGNVQNKLCGATAGTNFNTFYLLGGQ